MNLKRPRNNASSAQHEQAYQIESSIHKLLRQADWDNKTIKNFKSWFVSPAINVFTSNNVHNSMKNLKDLAKHEPEHLKHVVLNHIKKKITTRMKSRLQAGNNERSRQSLSRDRTRMLQNIVRQSGARVKTSDGGRYVPWFLCNEKGHQQRLRVPGIVSERNIGYDDPIDRGLVVTSKDMEGMLRYILGGVCIQYPNKCASGVRHAIRGNLSFKNGQSGFSIRDLEPKLKRYLNKGDFKSAYAIMAIKRNGDWGQVHFVKELRKPNIVCIKPIDNDVHNAIGTLLYINEQNSTKPRVDTISKVISGVISSPAYHAKFDDGYLFTLDNPCAFYALKNDVPFVLKGRNEWIFYDGNPNAWRAVINLNLIPATFYTSLFRNESTRPQARKLASYWQNDKTFAWADSVHNFGKDVHEFMTKTFGENGSNVIFQKGQIEPKMRSVMKQLGNIEGVGVCVMPSTNIEQKTKIQEYIKKIFPQDSKKCIVFDSGELYPKVSPVKDAYMDEILIPRLAISWARVNDPSTTTRRYSHNLSSVSTAHPENYWASRTWKQYLEALNLSRPDESFVNRSKGFMAARNKFVRTWKNAAMKPTNESSKQVFKELRTSVLNGIIQTFSPQGVFNKVYKVPEGANHVNVKTTNNKVIRLSKDTITRAKAKWKDILES